MHLGLVHYGDLSMRTGGFLYDRKIVSTLQANDHQVSLFSIPWRSYMFQLLDSYNQLLTAWLHEVQPDVLVQDELVHPSLFTLNDRLRRGFSGPIISLVHHLRSSEGSSRLINWLYMMIERKYLNSVDGYICNSQATLDSIIDCSNANLPSTIAYPGRDHILSTMSPFEIKQRAHRPGPLRLLFLGSIIRRKGLDTLLEALTGIDSSTWHLDIIGDATIDPRYSAAQKRTIRQANMSESITWHGSLSDASLEQLWSRSHVLVVPSRYEGFGIVYLEAMAKGLVPIGSSAGGAGELIEAGQDGFLVNPGDSAAIQSHILRLIGDRDFLARMAVAGAQRFHKHPTWEAAGHKIQSFLLQRIVDLP